jgi:hypothetical protein
MSEKNKPEDSAWERFFQFLAEDDEPVSRAEVRNDLQRLGVSPDSAIKRVFAALDAAAAQDQLRAASAQREGMVEKLRRITSESVSNPRDVIQRLIHEKLTGEVQAAYFHKLEGAASDADLASLLQDIERLEALESDADETK